MAGTVRYLEEDDEGTWTGGGAGAVADVVVAVVNGSAT